MPTRAVSEFLRQCKMKFKESTTSEDVFLTIGARNLVGFVEGAIIVANEIRDERLQRQLQSLEFNGEKDQFIALILKWVEAKNADPSKLFRDPEAHGYLEQEVPREILRWWLFEAN